MIPERAHCFALVETGGEHRIMVIPELARIGEVLRNAIAFRCCVTIMMVDGRGREGPADIPGSDRRQVVLATDQDRFAIAGHDRFTRRHAVEAP